MTPTPQAEFSASSSLPQLASSLCCTGAAILLWSRVCGLHSSMSSLWAGPGSNLVT